MKEPGKYKNMWKKYLPIIKILMKKAVLKPQRFKIQRTELKSLGDREKAGYSFRLEVIKGKVTNNISGTAVARDLRDVLFSDASVYEIFKQNDFLFRLDSDFVLLIQHL